MSTVQFNLPSNSKLFSGFYGVRFKFDFCVIDQEVKWIRVCENFPESHKVDSVSVKSRKVRAPRKNTSMLDEPTVLASSDVAVFPEPAAANSASMRAFQNFQVNSLGAAGNPMNMTSQALLESQLANDTLMALAQSYNLQSHMPF